MVVGRPRRYRHMKGIALVDGVFLWLSSLKYSAKYCLYTMHAQVHCNVATSPPPATCPQSVHAHSAIVRTRKAEAGGDARLTRLTQHLAYSPKVVGHSSYNFILAVCKSSESEAETFQFLNLANHKPQSLIPPPGLTDAFGWHSRFLIGVPVNACHARPLVRGCHCS